MTQDQFERLMQSIERTGRGWVYGGEIPACDVWLDGKLVRNVLAINRKRGVIRVARQPLRIDKHGKRVMFKVARGNVELVLLDKGSHD